MTILLLVRHGRSTSNTAGTLAGRTPGVELDELGRRQASSLADRLTGLDLTAAVHSPLERCRQTLSLALPGVTGVEDARFTECDYGEWSGRLLADLAGEPLWSEVQQHPSAVTFPGGESMVDMARRMVSGVEDWNERVRTATGEGEAVWALVSHGDPIKALLSHALGQPLDAFQRIVVDPASVSIVRWPDEQGAAPLVLAMNTTQGRVVERLAPGAPGAPQLGGGLGTQPR